MADGGGGSCVSYLSDDLLQHILSFATVSDRAATAVLSRRWLRLWRTSGDVYIYSGSFNGGGSSSPDPDQESEAFLRGAEKALAAAAAHGPIRRLTFSIAEDSDIILLTHCMHDDWSWSESEHNLIDELVSNPAARRVEELKIEVKPCNTGCKLSFGSLPSEALRVLRLINCCTLTAPPPGAAATAAAFPMLVELHLKGCCVSLVDFQTIIDAAPHLSTLHLASSSIKIDDTGDVDELVVGRLRIPAVTDLVVANCGYWHGEPSLELDVPRLQYFRYREVIQYTNHFSLALSTNLVQVDLHLTYDYHDYSDIPIPNLFWQFISNFNTTKHLKLKLDNITMDDLALEDMASRDELLGALSFDLLEQLELEAEYKYRPGFKASMVMLASLLHCCPKVRDLQLRFGKDHQMPWIESSVDKEAGAHFDKSVNGFRNRRRKSVVSLGGQNDVNYKASGIPGLTGEHSFSCLQSHLQSVSLHFFMDEPNCLEVQLAKFFTENAMALQQMHIDDGSQEMLEHVNSSVRRWIANRHNGSKQVNEKD